MSNATPKNTYKRLLRRNILMIALIPLIFLAIVSCVISLIATKNLMNKSMQDNLKAVAISMRDTYSQMNSEPYVNKGTESSPKVFKGDYNIGKHTNIVDSLNNDGGMVSTIFWNNTRIMTSLKDEQGERKIGTTLDDKEVLTDVLENGEGHFESNFMIDNTAYYVYYLPLYQEGSHDEIIGMIFVGAAAEHAESIMASLLFFTIGAALVICIVALIFITIAVGRITKALRHGVDVLNHVADGDLTVMVEPGVLRRRDELGSLANAIEILKEQLISIIGGIKMNSNQLLESSDLLDRIAKETASTVEQVEKAVEDIAQGATSQAQETQKASEDVLVMGDLISLASSDAQELDKNAMSMKQSSDEASATLVELKDNNQKSIQAIDIISEQTNVTNESALKIQEATHLISSISEETNLLSLNASIEAARAGEQGRGFAVVANQIQSLAEQSNEAALKIDEITATLIRDSEKAVETMFEVKQIMDEQSKSVEKTERIFDTVKKGIDLSYSSAMSIGTQTDSLDESRVSIVDIVQNLTAVAEENAASTQETSAAAAEVSSTVADVSSSAENLKQIASSLDEYLQMFKL